MAKTSKKKPVKKSELEISRKNEIIMGIQVCEARERLDAIAQIIENVDNRCMAADGPVTPTLKEMTQEEIKVIYELAKLHRQAGKPLQVVVSKQYGSWRIHIHKGVQSFRLDYRSTEKSECEWVAHMLRLALASGDAGKTQDILQDAGCMIRRLVHRFRQQGRDATLIRQANDWLRRKGLQDSVLREGGL